VRGCGAGRAATVTAQHSTVWGPQHRPHSCAEVATTAPPACRWLCLCLCASLCASCDLRSFCCLRPVSCVPALRSIAHSEAWLLLAAGCHNPGKRISPKLRFLVKFATQAPPAAALPRPRSTPMALQAPELPAGRELMSERWCYFCGRKGKPTRGSSRGRKRVAFVRCGQYSHAIVGVTPHDYERAMAGCICPTHTVSVTYKLGVTTAG
jgi:hypothetical protein